jgi:tetratricopeptide (TPR) repeat protein
MAMYELKKGSSEKALAILDEKVEGKTFEPHVLYQVGFIYKAAGESEKARNYLQQADEASFELGPLLSKKIKNDLKEINTKS